MAGTAKGGRHAGRAFAPERSGRRLGDIEPAGQLELSGAPLENIHQTCAEISAHMKQVHEVPNVWGRAISRRLYAVLV